jgi:hypothetical protein
MISCSASLRFQMCIGPESDHCVQIGPSESGPTRPGVRRSDWHTMMMSHDPMMITRPWAGPSQRRDSESVHRPRRPGPSRARAAPSHWQVTSHAGVPRARGRSVPVPFGLGLSDRPTAAGTRPPRRDGRPRRLRRSAGRSRCQSQSTLVAPAQGRLGAQRHKVRVGLKIGINREQNVRRTP